jgi:hypothetical protein
MADHTTESTQIERPALEGDVPITVKVVLTATGSGIVGMVLMLPVLVGLPLLFDLFRTEPIAEFAPFIEFLGVQPSLTLGVSLFVLGGATVLPLMFVVVGSFLPPERPRYLRGVVFGTIFWPGFVLAFWPGGNQLTIALFILVSLLAHWIYGGALGVILSRTTGIPQHEV